jgi:hypothetical protein
MFGIPEWAIGVGFVVLAAFTTSLVSRLVSSFLPDSRLRRGKGSGHDLVQALEEVQRRLGEVEQAQSKRGEVADVETRLGELEERLDFAERLLTKQRDAERLGPPRP